MGKGRRVGQIEVTLDEIETIISMTKEGRFRSDIAETVGRSTHTVWRYQQKFC